MGYILNGGHHLLNLINEVLDFSRIESGRLSLSPEPILVRSVVLEAIDTMRVLAVRQAILIETDIESFGEHLIVADRQRFKQILLNLLSNAIKYNRADGLIRVSCRIGGGRLRVAVADTGVGIDPAQHHLIFTPFERLGAERGMIEGTGLGLALSKRLVEAMAGELGYESEFGRGTTFWIEFPMSAAQSAELLPVPLPGSLLAPAGDRIIHVLLIEDNLPNLRLIERVLPPTSGFRITAAMQGQLGCDLAAQIQPDLILLDLHLPDMHGKLVLERLKAESATRAIPVVIITADATSGESRRLVDQGARAYMTKPLDVPAFLETVKGILGL